MTVNNIIPIKGAHQSASSLLAEAMSDPHNKNVIFFGFDNEGVMRYGEYGLTLNNLCMVLGKVLEMSNRMMAEDD